MRLESDGNRGSKGDNMERVNCMVIENDILEFLDEAEQQLSTGVVCCKCKNPCEKDTKCAMAMKNLLTDIRLFKETYKERTETKKETE